MVVIILMLFQYASKVKKPGLQARFVAKKRFWRHYTTLYYITLHYTI